MTDVGLPTDSPADPAAFHRLKLTVGDGNETGSSEGVLLTRDGTWIAVWY